MFDLPSFCLQQFRAYSSVRNASMARSTSACSCAEYMLCPAARRRAADAQLHLRPRAMG